VRIWAGLPPQRMDELVDNNGNVRALARVAEGIALWWCELECSAADAGRFATCLAPAEHARAARFGTDALRRRWIAGRSALRHVLGLELGMPAVDVPISRGRRGRPELRGIPAAPDFNVSHTDGVALIGIARTATRDIRIGVDVERSARKIGTDRLAHKFLTARERQAASNLAPEERRRMFLCTWTCKEAMSKATGDGLLAPFRELDVDSQPAPRLLAGPPPYRPAAWTLYRPSVPAEYLAAVAVWDRTSIAATDAQAV
jgi:4'-phosphopantetheinyl transferase